MPLSHSHIMRVRDYEVEEWRNPKSYTAGLEVAELYHFFAEVIECRPSDVELGYYERCSGVIACAVMQGINELTEDQRESIVDGNGMLGGYVY